MRTHAPAWGVLVAAFSVILVVGLGAFGVGRVVDAWVGELPSVHDPNAFAYSAKTRIYANDRTTLLAEFYLQDQEPIEKDQVGNYVLEGTVRVTIGKNDLVLNEGDSLYFDPTLPHGQRAVGEKGAKFLTIIL